MQTTVIVSIHIKVEAVQGCSKIQVWGDWRRIWTAQCSVSIAFSPIGVGQMHTHFENMVRMRMLVFIAAKIKRFPGAMHALLLSLSWILPLYGQIWSKGSRPCEPLLI